MAELKLRNELGLNRSLAILEPARRCAARCTWCYVEPNRKGQWGGKARSDADAGSFERLAERAFGPEYDPTDLLQWQLHHKVPFVYATGVEPFQDLGQARAILAIIDALKLPVFFQTRGTHWREVWDLVGPLAGNAAFYVSIPSLNPAYVKRFEPGTPPVAEREALVRACAAAGIPCMVAVAPYHPSWSTDLPGMVAEFHSWGATDVFLDVLHLSRTQREVIEGPVDPSTGARKPGGDVKLLELLGTTWSDDAALQWADAAGACMDRGMGFVTHASEAIAAEIPSFEGPDPWPYRDAFAWPYVDTAYHDALEAAHAGEVGDGGGPILLDWPDALRIMEAHGGRVDQHFSWKSMSEFRAVRDLAPAWKAQLGGRDGRGAAPFREYLRALWNDPSANGFPWHHPFVRYAARPDGTPHRGATGDLVMAYDPDWAGRSLARELPALHDHFWYRTEG